MLYYTVTLRCHHCLCPSPWGIASETEPPADFVVKVICPSHGGPIPVPFRYFKRVEALPPDVPFSTYPPSPPKPPVPLRTASNHRWWQFWKRS